MRIRPLYLINGQTSQIRLGLCKCRQARITDEIRIATQGSSRCKDGGRGTVMMGLDNRGGVMLWILNVNGVCSEGFNRCQTMNRSMCCSNRRSCQHRISCSEKKERITIPTSNVMVKSDCYKNRLTFSAIYETVNPNIFEWLILNRYVVFLPY